MGTMLRVVNGRTLWWIACTSLLIAACEHDAPEPAPPLPPAPVAPPPAQGATPAPIAPPPAQGATPAPIAPPPAQGATPTAPTGTAPIAPAEADPTTVDKAASRQHAAPDRTRVYQPPASAPPPSAEPEARRPEPSQPAAPAEPPAPSANTPPAATAPRAPTKKVVVPATDHVRIDVPRGLQALLDADPRMQPWVDKVIAVIDRCYGSERARSADAAGVVEIAVTMHLNARPDADVKSVPPQLGGVVACATPELMRARPPLFTGPEGERHTLRIRFAQ